MDTNIYKLKALALGIIIIATAGLTSNAQQEQLNTQYMFNTQSINPAYAGTWESAGFTILTGQQWGGFEGAPQSYSFSLQAPLSNKKSGLGLNIVNDKVGFEKRFCTFGDYSYLIKVNKTTNLRLGIKGGFSHYSGYDNNLLKSEQIIPEQQERNTRSMLNAGAGAFLYNKKYYVGFSVPKIISNKYEDDVENFALDNENQQYYLMSGFIVNMGRNLIFKPTTMAIATLASNSGRPAEINLAANFLVKEKLWFGAMFRTNNTYGFMAQWIFNRNLRLGYAYDMTASNLSIQQNSSHNLMVSYELASLTNNFASLRYF